MNTNLQIGGMDFDAMLDEIFVNLSDKEFEDLVYALPDYLWKDASKPAAEPLALMQAERLKEELGCQFEHTTKRAPGNRLRARVLARDNHTCQHCGRGIKHGVILVMDHKHPWAKGGETTYENLQTLCEECNSGKSDLLLQPSQALQPVIEAFSPAATLTTLAQPEQALQPA